MRLAFGQGRVRAPPNKVATSFPLFSRRPCALPLRPVRDSSFFSPPVPLPPPRSKVVRGEGRGPPFSRSFPFGARAFVGDSYPPLPPSAPSFWQLTRLVLCCAPPVSREPDVFARLRTAASCRSSNARDFFPSFPDSRRRGE